MNLFDVLRLSFATAAAIVIALIRPGWAGVVIGVWALTMFVYCALTLAGTLWRRTRARRSLFDDVMYVRTPMPSRPADLKAFEASFGWGTYEPREFDVRIRPLVNLLAQHGADRNATRHPLLQRLAGQESAEDIYGRPITGADLSFLIGQIEDAG
jgi:hypothetical protein